ncbi:MAG: nucleotide pyrophosphatase [Zunongwangia sp.]|nr:alkaline phosphatase family protein [Zunongwangia profunda]MAC64390.1 nucleotide pyrophosphatase [Flavobacteriaceae bacterium]MAO34964.1 nucleotide pyrophosphatase [Zunongwangia sp.]MAS71764.1 nucleotide pyrophosphatase [Zunongwangia sp.]HAJ81357.1 nucleotide pyrophosphatase [Zunongwangia profunda]|tara:strand:- start:2670 stop:3926 length:1257 start_codon:yes stop_codon:yes gene_type:complete
MKFKITSVALMLLLCSYQMIAQGDRQKEKKLVFIIVDGIAADMIPKTSTPNLDAISLKGDFSEAYVGGGKGTYSETPTISAVGYNSLLTGVWVNKHNVYGNEIKQPNYNYPSIFRLFTNDFPEKQTAIFSTWEDNRTKLLGENLVGTNFLKIDYAFDGFEKDTLNFPHDPYREYIKNIDKKVAYQAAEYIQNEAPDLTWVYLEFSDDMGHGYGDSPQLYNAITFEDELIGKIYEAIKYRESNFNEDWLFIVTTDHGRTAKDGKHHGGQSDRERSTWIAMNKKGNSYFKEQIPGIVDILPTMISFLELYPETSVKEELDGVSLLGMVDAVGLSANLYGATLKLNWKALSDTDTPAKFYVARTNKVKYGAKDEYELLGSAKIKNGTAEFNIGKKADIYKILMETPNHRLNTWITPTQTNN